MDLWTSTEDPDDGFFLNNPVKDLNSGPDLVKAGVAYSELSPMHTAALEANNLEKCSVKPTKSLQSYSPNSGDDEMTYESLADPQEFRVLELHPGRYEEEIRCSLHVCAVALDREYDYLVDRKVGTWDRTTSRTQFVVSSVTGQPIWYTALSYVWGDSIFSMPMKCNQKIFRTTKNLDVALRHLRDPKDSVMLWADQICINQNDLQEKTQQVLLMSKIYERAHSTVVWLGEEADNSDGAVGTLFAIKYALRWLTEEKAPDIGEFQRLSLPEPNSQDWVDLRKFLSRPWFHRVWILQEVVLQRTVEFICGSKCFDWNDLALFAYYMVKYDMEQFLGFEEASDQETSESSCTRIRMISDMKDYHQGFEQKSSLFAVLIEGRGAKATNLRDKVFGVMGMSDQVVYPDYERPIPDVYREACKACLNSADVVRLLCSVDHAQPSVEMPSWVPDWSTPRQTVSLGYTGKEHAVYKAATWDVNFAGYKLKSLKVDDESSLVIEGIMFDSIRNTCGLGGSDLHEILIESPTRQFLLECVRVAIKEGERYASTKGLFEAFWKTLVAGKDHTGVLKAPSEYAEIFALLLNTANGCSPTLPDQPQYKRKLTLKNLESRRPHRLYREMQIAFKAAVRNRKFCTTSKGYMGLFPRGTQAGDRICVFLGAPVPFVIRPHKPNKSYQLIGECYVHGIMEGEILEVPGIQSEDITII